MSYTAPSLGAHGAAVLAVLVAAGGAVSPAVPVQAGRKTDDSAADRYAVLWPLPGGYDGPVADPSADLLYAFQVTAVGQTVEQADAVADLMAAALLNTPPAVAGRSVDLVMPTGGTGVLRDDDAVPPVYYRASTYQVHTSPA